jgi:hypothetical protein
MIRADKCGQWKREQSREDRGVNIVATIVSENHTASNLNVEALVSYKIYLSVMKPREWFIGYQLSEEHSFFIVKMEALVQQICWMRCYFVYVTCLLCPIVVLLPPGQNQIAVK